MYLKYLVLLVLILIIFVLLREYSKEYSKEEFQTTTTSTTISTTNGGINNNSTMTIYYISPKIGVEYTYEKKDDIILDLQPGDKVNTQVSFKFGSNVNSINKDDFYGNFIMKSIRFDGGEEDRTIEILSTATTATTDTGPELYLLDENGNLSDKKFEINETSLSIPKKGLTFLKDLNTYKYTEIKYEIEQVNVIIFLDIKDDLTINKIIDLQTPIHESMAVINRENIKSVIVGTTVTSIGNYAFTECSSLVSVTIGNNVTSIGNEAFRSCESLASVTIGNNVTSIGEQAFRLCKSLDSVIIPDSVETIKNNAFSMCENLKTVTIGNNVKSIHDAAFVFCISLESVTIPDSVETLGESAFEKCSALKSFTIGNNVTSIPNRCFVLCTSLETCTIGNSVISIGDYAFYNCPAIKYIEFKTNGSTKSINFGNYVFGGDPGIDTSKLKLSDGKSLKDSIIYGKISIPPGGLIFQLFTNTTTTPLATTTTPLATTTTPLATTTTPFATTTTPLATTTTPLATTTTPLATTTTPLATTTPRNVSSTSPPSSFNFSDPTELKILHTNALNRRSDLQFRINGNITDTQLQMIEGLIQ